MNTFTKDVVADLEGNHLEITEIVNDHSNRLDDLEVRTEEVEKFQVEAELIQETQSKEIDELETEQRETEAILENNSIQIEELETKKVFICFYLLH